MTHSQQLWASRAAVLIAAILFGALIIGDRPFATDAADKAVITQSGSAFNRVVIFGAFAGGLAVGTAYLERAVRLALRNWPVSLLVLWICASFLWGSHPGLTVRRSLALVLVYIILVSLAAASRSPRDMMTPIVLVFATVMILNLITLVAMPEVSRSPLGHTGIFDNKNSAGSVAALAILVLGTAAAAAGGTMLRAALLGLLGFAWIFLISTESKTSIGLAALLTVIGPIIYVWLISNGVLKVAAIIGGLALALSAVVIFYALGYDDTDFRYWIFGDPTFTGRTQIWQALIPEIARRPWLGYGFGSFWDTGGEVNPIVSAAPWLWFMDAQIINTAHSGYLDIWLQTGVVGFILAVIAILRCLWLLLLVAARSGGTDRVIFSGALCVALFLALNNLLESYLFRTGDGLGYLFLFVMLHAEAACLRMAAGGAVADLSSARWSAPS